MTDVKTKGLVELYQLIDYMAVKTKGRPIPKRIFIHKKEGGPPPTGAIIERDNKYYRVISSDPEKLEPAPGDFNVIHTSETIAHARQFQNIFDTHWLKYRRQMPGASIDQYRRHAIEWLTQKLETVKKEAPSAWNAPVIEWVKAYINDYLKAETNEKGIKCSLSAGQLMDLYNRMKGQYITGHENNFVAAFTHEQLPPGFKPLKWIDLAPSGRNAGRSNEATLRAFIVAMKGDKTVRLDDVKKFADKTGKAFDKISNRQNDFYERKNIKLFNDLIAETKP